MKHNRTKVGLLLCCLPALLVPPWALALNLGELRLTSAADAPLEAEIAVTGIAADGQESLSVGLADVEGFRWAGIEWSPALERLRFELRRGADGTQSIRIYTVEALAVSRLHFLLKVTWSRGRVFREYILDLEQAPGSADPARLEPSLQTAAPAATGAAEDDRANVGQAAPAPDVYDVVWGDTLWDLAHELRPDASVTVNQVMLALLRVNPAAFSHDNINWLLAGASLQAPTMADVQALTAAEAYAEVLAQNNVWRLTRGYATIDAGTRAPPGTAAPDTELRLAPVSAEDVGLAGATTEPAGGAQPQPLSPPDRQVEELSQGNADLEQPLSQADSAIAGLKRLVEVKDEELAAMQEQVRRDQARPGPGLFDKVQSLSVTLFETTVVLLRERWRIMLAAVAVVVVLLGWLLLTRRAARREAAADAASPIHPGLPQALGEPMTDEADEAMARERAAPGDNSGEDPDGYAADLPGAAETPASRDWIDEDERPEGDEEAEWDGQEEDVVQAADEETGAGLQEPAGQEHEEPENEEQEDEEAEWDGQEEDVVQAADEETGASLQEPAGQEHEEPENEEQEDEEAGDEEDDKTRSKIDLARAYLELGDAENVRSILDEVLAEGNTAQREEARRLLERVHAG